MKTDFWPNISTITQTPTILTVNSLATSFSMLTTAYNAAVFATHQAGNQRAVSIWRAPVLHSTCRSMLAPHYTAMTNVRAPGSAWAHSLHVQCRRRSAASANCEYGPANHTSDYRFLAPVSGRLPANQDAGDGTRQCRMDFRWQVPVGYTCCNVMLCNVM